MSTTAVVTPTCPEHGERPVAAGLPDHPGFSGWGEVQTLDGSGIKCLRCGDCGRVLLVDAPLTATPQSGHETWGWDGSTGYRCRCGQMLAPESWRDAEPLWRAHVAGLGGPMSEPSSIRTTTVPPEGWHQITIHERIAAVVRQAIHGSHDHTYQFPDDVEGQVGRVTSIVLGIVQMERDEIRKEAFAEAAEVVYDARCQGLGLESAERMLRREAGNR